MDPDRRRTVLWQAGEHLSLPLLLGRLLASNAAPAHDLDERTVLFGEEPSQRFLVVRPAEGGPSGPLVYFLHGGGWRHGAPERFRFIGRFFASHGLACALGGYRLVPEHTYPAQLDDALAGVRMARELALTEEWGDGSVVLAGQSAGAHLAALVAYDRESREGADIADAAIRALLLVSGPLDFEALCPVPEACELVAGLMDGRDGWDAADPVRFVREGDRWPVLCIHGEHDPLVPVAASESFVDRVNAVSPDLGELIVVPKAYHSELVALFWERLPESIAITEWLARVVPDVQLATGR